MENDVVSLETARKLKQKGVEQESEYFWKYLIPSLNEGTGGDAKWVLVRGKSTPPIVSAYTLEELRARIFAYCKDHHLPVAVNITKNDKEALLTSDGDTFSGKNELEAYATYFIYLLTYKK